MPGLALSAQSKDRDAKMVFKKRAENALPLPGDFVSDCEEWNKHAHLARGECHDHITHTPSLLRMR
jgi:hypothetical protein